MGAARHSSVCALGLGAARAGSAGCGRVKVSTSGTFSGDNMHLNAGLTSDCIHAKLSGDLGR